MPLVRKRRAAEERSESSSSRSDTPPRARQTRSPSAGSPQQEDGFGEDDSLDHGGHVNQMVKKMVRLALASEYARQPIRRADVTAKVLGQHNRGFKVVFEKAQTELRSVFGMELVELPMKEKPAADIETVVAAQRTDKVATASKVYVLRSVLPEKFRADESILLPSKAPTSEHEATYVGIYTFIISIIYLCGGSIAEAKLDKYLKRTNTDSYTPIEKTEKLIQRLCKEGYLLKVKESSGGDETIEYLVGPRGKIEVGPESVAGIIKSVYGEEGGEDLEARIQRSLALEDNVRKRKSQVSKPVAPPKARSGGQRRSTRSRAAAGDDDDDNDEEEERVQDEEDSDS
ncbi:MAG: hypothetical protein M1825_006449 [Sarcosagium campestre]|nr:MAG: hypothetical protein M1825_006449 [Sarcosagium campestre]